MSRERSDIMDDFHGYMQRHRANCAIEGLWEGVVNWTDAPPGDDWHFIIGKGHCGSSVLARILSTHPDVYSANEDCTVLNTLALFSSRVVITSGVQAFNWFNREWADHKHPFASEHRNVTAAYLRDLAEVWRKHAAPGAQHIGDKHVWYLSCRDKLRKIFPGLNFIYTVRHPLSQLAGMIHDGWRGNDALATQPAVAWVIVSGLVHTYLELEQELDVLIVRYEDLCALPSLVDTATLCWEVIGADTSAIPEADLAAFAGSQFARDWQSDEAIQHLVKEWAKEGLATEAQLKQVMAPIEGYEETLSAMDWM